MGDHDPHHRSPEPEVSARAVAGGSGVGFAAGWNIADTGAVADELAGAYGVGLAVVGLGSADELFRSIPRDVQLNRALDVTEPLAESEVIAGMEKLAAEQDKEGVPKSHRLPARPGAEAVLLAVAQAFGVNAEAVQSRSHQPAFRAWVYLLRRASNLSLREAGEHAGVSPGRISQIQRVIEAENPAPELAKLMQRYKVKA